MRAPLLCSSLEGTQDWSVRDVQSVHMQIPAPGFVSIGRLRMLEGSLQVVHPFRGSCREEGMLGLWRGLGPNVARNAIVNAAELASFDQVQLSHSLSVHCLSSPEFKS